VSCYGNIKLTKLTVKLSQKNENDTNKLNMK
jgi:hypothetical protein